MKNPFIFPPEKRLNYSSSKDRILGNPGKRLNNSSSKDRILGNPGKTPKLFFLERLDSRKSRKNA